MAANFPVAVQKLCALALTTALPVAVVMLLVCNSLEISGVRDLADSFLRLY